MKLEIQKKTIYTKNYRGSNFLKNSTTFGTKYLKNMQ
jgi:hypothetical protein